MRRIIRLGVLAASVAIVAHTLTNDDRSNWIAVVPGLVLAAALAHAAASVEFLHKVPVGNHARRPRMVCDWTAGSAGAFRRY